MPAAAAWRVAFARMAPEQRAAALVLLGATEWPTPQRRLRGGVLTTAVLIGAGGATAVGLLFAGGGGSSGDHEVVSP